MTQNLNPTTDKSKNADDPKARFCRVPPRAMSDRRLKLVPMRVLLAICYHARGPFLKDGVTPDPLAGKAWPSNELLASETGIAQSNVWAAVNKLVDLGYISRIVGPKPRGGLATVYTVLPGPLDTAGNDAQRATDETAGDSIPGNAVHPRKGKRYGNGKGQHTGEDRTAYGERNRQHSGKEAAAFPGMPEHPNNSEANGPSEQQAPPSSAAARLNAPPPPADKTKDPEAFEGTRPALIAVKPVEIRPPEQTPQDLRIAELAKSIGMEAAILRVLGEAA